MKQVLRWTRLEPNSREPDLAGGLRAEAADPLWMLGRQWQLGEYHGDDAGSPIGATLVLDSTPATRYAPRALEALSAGRAATARALNRDQPLETLVEREPLRDEAGMGPALAAELGLQLLRLFDQIGIGEHRRGLLDRFPLTANDAEWDVDTRRFQAVMARRVPDGALLAAVFELRDRPEAAATWPKPVRDRVAGAAVRWDAWMSELTPDASASIAAAVANWRQWRRGLISEPGDSDTAWMPDRLEYAFAIGVPTPRGEQVLVAREYMEGRLDWSAFDVAPGASVGASRADLQPEDVATERVRWTAIPTPIRYPGMPVSRYWQFEDARVDFGSVAAGAQQLAHLLFIEFALVTGDDWFSIPVEMTVGSLATVRWLVVADTFNEQLLVRSARDVDRDHRERSGRWDMFRLSADTVAREDTQAGRDLFLLPAALGSSLAGKPIEEVALIRDEMANLAWAVERIVESPIGLPLDRTAAFHRGRSPADPSGPTVAAAGSLPRYRLTTSAPPHWLPLYPARSEDGSPAIQLRRGGRPQGRLLGPMRVPLYIRDEEVPREGIRVTRAFQHARWIDGSTHLWVARRKRVGQAEGSSGIQFDVVDASASASALP